MKTIIDLLSRTFLFLVTIGFIIPAILFSCLVIGFTDTWEPGLPMLISSIVLIVVVKLLTSGRIVVYTKSRRNSRIVYDVWHQEEAPPPLRDIDAEIAALNKAREQDMEEVLQQYLRAQQPRHGSGPPDGPK